MAESVKVIKTRQVKTPEGYWDYQVLTDDKGQDYYFYGNNEQQMNQAKLWLEKPDAAKMLRIDPSKQLLSNKKPEEYKLARLENAFYKSNGGKEKFDNSSIFEKYIKDPSTISDALITAAEKGQLRIDQQSKSFYADPDLVSKDTTLTTTDDKGNTTLTKEGKDYVDAGIVNGQEIINTVSDKTQASKPMLKDDPTYQNLMGILGKMTEGEVPEFNAETYSSKWLPDVNAMAKPYEEAALKSMRANQSLGASLGGRSSIMDNQINTLLKEFEAQKMQTALGLGTNTYNAELDKFMNALTMKGDLALKGNAQEYGDYAQNQARNWQIADQANQRLWQNQDWQKSSDLATRLAEISKAKQPQWYDYLAQGLGTAAGTIAGGKLSKLAGIV